MRLRLWLREAACTVIAPINIRAHKLAWLRFVPPVRSVKVPEPWRTETRDTPEALRTRWSRSDPHALLLKTGRMAKLAQLPLVGRALRLSGTVMVDPRMPDFRTTWINTYDAYGPHAFQRYVAPEAFWAYFDRVPRMEIQFRDGGVVAARKQAS